MFEPRAERRRGEPGGKPGARASYIGVGLLAFLPCALVILGLMASLMTHDSRDPRDAAVPFEAFLMVTPGIL